MISDRMNDKRQTKLQAIIRTLEPVEEIMSPSELRQLLRDLQEGITDILETPEETKKPASSKETSNTTSTVSEESDDSEWDSDLERERMEILHRGQNLTNVRKFADTQCKEMATTASKAKRIGEKAWRLRGSDSNFTAGYTPWELRKAERSNPDEVTQKDVELIREKMCKIKAAYEEKAEEERILQESEEYGSKHAPRRSLQESRSPRASPRASPRTT